MSRPPSHQLGLRHALHTKNPEAQNLNNVNGHKVRYFFVLGFQAP